MTPRLTKRFVFVCTLLGAATTVLVSWILALNVDASRSRPRYAFAEPAIDGTRVVIWRVDAFGAFALYANAPFPFGASEVFVPLEEAVPEWIAPDLLEWTQTPGFTQLANSGARATLAAGWPFACMRTTFDQVQSNGTWWFKARDGIAIGAAETNPRPNSILTPRELALPIRVNWGGFALNTIFWATLWVLASLIPRTLRMALRKRRRQCLACGYDRRALDASNACPECGHLSSGAASARRASST